MTNEIPDDLQRALARIAVLEAAIEWALGAAEDFRARRDGEGAYWWRAELRQRAALETVPDRFHAGLVRAAEIAAAIPHRLIPVGPMHARGLRGSDVAEVILAEAGEISPAGLGAAQAALDRMAARAATPEDERIAAVAGEFAKLGSDSETLGTRMVEPAPRAFVERVGWTDETPPRFTATVVYEEAPRGPSFATVWEKRPVAIVEIGALGVTTLPAERLAEIEANAKAAPAGPWQLTRCDDGLLMVHTVGDVICLSDPNCREPDDAKTMRHLAGLDRDTVLAMTAEIRSLARRLGDAEHKAAGLEAGRAVLVQERDEAREAVAQVKNTGWEECRTAAGRIADEYAQGEYSPGDFGDAIRLTGAAIASRVGKLTLPSASQESAHG